MNCSGRSDWHACRQAGGVRGVGESAVSRSGLDGVLDRTRQGGWIGSREYEPLSTIH